MIIVDTSALIAILFREPEEDIFMNLLLGDGSAEVAAPTVLETMMVMHRASGAAGRDEVESLLAEVGIQIRSWDEGHLAAAHDAFVRYGKGSGHPAQLNFGDCIAYALARTLDAPLLFKGDDFARTDVRAAL